MSNENYVLVYHKDFTSMVTNNFKFFLDHELYIDLIFVCKNNKKVGAHQVVFGCLSKFFYSIFIENVNSMKEKVMHIYVPDIRAKIMKYILQFIYSGKAMLNKEELAEFNEDIKLLGMPLDHFSTPSEATESAGLIDPILENTPHVPEVPLQDTVDLTEPCLIEDQEQSINRNLNRSSQSLVQGTPVPPSLPILSDINVDTRTVSTPPIPNRGLTKNERLKRKSEAEKKRRRHIQNNPTLLKEENYKRRKRYARRIKELKYKVSSSHQSTKVSESENRSASTVANCSNSTVVRGNKESDRMNAKSTVSSRPENSKPISRKRKKNNSAPPSSKNKIPTACIDLDESDDDDDAVITIS